METLPADARPANTAHQPTSRRRLLGLFASAAPAIALASATSAKLPISEADRFVLAMSTIHRDGAKAARAALAAGANPQDLYSVITFRRDDEPGLWPALLFDTGKGIRTFTPRGETQRGAK